GDFYYKRKNYRAARDRYKEALIYKPNDAIANFRLGECEEKTGDPKNAATYYQAYLKILPHGPLAVDAQKALERLKGTEAKGAVWSSLFSSRLGAVIISAERRVTWPLSSVNPFPR